MDDLSLVTAKELADELMNRSDCAVVIFSTLEGKHLYTNWHGNYYKALGFCVDMQRHIMETAERVDEDKE